MKRLPVFPISIISENLCVDNVFELLTAANEIIIQRDKNMTGINCTGKTLSPLERYVIKAPGTRRKTDSANKSQSLGPPKCGINSKINNNENHKILEKMREHIEEIEERYNNEDEHWAIETADLIVLFYELLIMENKDIDNIFDDCLPIFDYKLKSLAKNIY